MVSRTILPARDADTAVVMEDLIRESLQILLPVTVAVSWIWLAVEIVVLGQHLSHAYAALALIGLAVAGCYMLYQRHLRLAVGAYVAGLLGVATLLAWCFTIPSVLNLYALVVLITAMLTNAGVMWGVAGVSAVSALLIGLSSGQMTAGDLVTSLTFILLSALAAWLSSRRLFTALHWALSMTQQAQKSAQDARARRAEVRSMLKSLDEAYARLERTNEALMFAREAAERAYRFKAEFVANVSHELRTPLNLIVGFSEMIATAPESYKGTPLPSEYRGDVMAIYRSARHLGELINDVLDLSQVESGRLSLEREPAELEEIVHEAVGIVRGLAEAKGLRLEVDVPEDLPRLRLDRTRIRQVLLNLLTNATRFTDQGWICLRTWLDGQQVWVTVEDSGQGIPQERVGRAFEAFSQLHDGQAREGSGLGLAVSKRFVELHGGTMAIESTLGQGTTVSFTLPVPGSGLDVPLALLKPDASVPGQEGQPWVLVLHDDTRVAGLLRRYAEGYQFIAADTVESACTLIGEALPAAVIMDGSWAARWTEIAARSPVPARVPVLSCPLPGLRRLAQALGALEYLTKPVTREQLLASLARLPYAPQTVLVVDDDPSFVRLVTRVLKAHDATMTILEASGGEEGLALLRARRPDVVLLDLLMPEVSGYDLLVEIRSDETLSGIPVIIMSARGVEDETAPLQGDFYLTRGQGFAPGQVVEVIQALLPVVTRQGAVDPPVDPTSDERRPGVPLG